MRFFVVGLALLKRVVVIFFGYVVPGNFGQSEFLFFERHHQFQPVTNESAPRAVRPTRKRGVVFVTSSFFFTPNNCLGQISLEKPVSQLLQSFFLVSLFGHCGLVPAFYTRNTKTGLELRTKKKKKKKKKGPRPALSLL